MGADAERMMEEGLSPRHGVPGGLRRSDESIDDKVASAIEGAAPPLAPRYLIVRYDTTSSPGKTFSGYAIFDTVDRCMVNATEKGFDTRENRLGNLHELSGQIAHRRSGFQFDIYAGPTKRVVTSQGDIMAFSRPALTVEMISDAVKHYLRTQSEYRETEAKIL